MSTNPLTGSISNSDDIFTVLKQKQYIVWQKTDATVDEVAMMIISISESNAVVYQTYANSQKGDFDKQLSTFSNENYTDRSNEVINGDEIARKIISQLHEEYTLFSN